VLKGTALNLMGTARTREKPHGRSHGFTLLELLAAVALLVILGTLLFQIFGQTSHVMRMGLGRVEVYQSARALFFLLEHELPGAIGHGDSAPSIVGTPFRVYTTDTARQSSGLDTRDGTDAISLVAALVGRDGIEGSATYGQTANSAYVAYWVSPDDFALNRYESYDLNTPASGRGWELALNVLEFRIQCFDPYHTPIGLRRMDWDSATPVAAGGRRGLPPAVMVTVKLTDTDHIRMYEFDPAAGASRLKEGFSAEDDPITQEFCEVIRIR